MFFSSDYRTARERFRAAAQAAGAALHALALDAAGPRGEALTIDIAWLGGNFILRELGTYPPLAVLHALREENRWHHYGSGSLDHPARRRLREALCPAAFQWRAQVVAKGIGLVRAAADWTFKSDER